MTEEVKEREYTCIYPPCGKKFNAESRRYYCSPACEQKNIAQWFKREMYEDVEKPSKIVQKRQDKRSKRL